MVLISLNTWGGRVGKPVLDYFSSHSDADIFLLQEMFHRGTPKTLFDPLENKRLFEDIDEALPDHDGYFAPAQDDEWGLAIFIRRGISILDYGDVFVYRHKDAMVGQDGRTVGKNLQYVAIAIGEKKINILNFHGLWNGNGKDDTADRLSQSRKIIDFARTREGEIIMAGDFNLRPDTVSLKMLENELQMVNLIEEHRIESTRTSFYPKSERFADYILHSSGINVKRFEVMSEEVSDHAALLLEFD